MLFRSKVANLNVETCSLQKNVMGQIKKEHKTERKHIYDNKQMCNDTRHLFINTHIIYKWKEHSHTDTHTPTNSHKQKCTCVCQHTSCIVIH